MVFTGDVWRVEVSQVFEWTDEEGGNGESVRCGEEGSSAWVG